MSFRLNIMSDKGICDLLKWIKDEIFEKILPIRMFARMCIECWNAAQNVKRGKQKEGKVKRDKITQCE